MSYIDFLKQMWSCTDKASRQPIPQIVVVFFVLGYTDIYWCLHKFAFREHKQTWRDINTTQKRAQAVENKLRYKNMLAWSKKCTNVLIRGHFMRIIHMKCHWNWKWALCITLFVGIYVIYQVLIFYHLNTGWPVLWFRFFSQVKCRYLTLFIEKKCKHHLNKVWSITEE